MKSTRHSATRPGICNMCAQAFIRLIIVGHPQAPARDEAEEPCCWSRSCRRAANTCLQHVGLAPQCSKKGGWSEQTTQSRFPRCSLLHDEACRCRGQVQCGHPARSSSGPAGCLHRATCCLRHPGDRPCRGRRRLRLECGGQRRESRQAARARATDPRLPARPRRAACPRRRRRACGSGAARPGRPSRPATSRPLRWRARQLCRRCSPATRPSAR
mmetsp:Transcript_4730/g.12157  ORF Transcript_4730/g.12157 Transcript_4730/m.12157 type:complete len:215 (-) Transcript_4730:1239-1883(-)